MSIKPYWLLDIMIYADCRFPAYENSGDTVGNIMNIYKF